MAEVTLALLDSKARTAEEVFGWGRSTVELGLKELRSGIVCINDLSKRRKPTSEEAPEAAGEHPPHHGPQQPSAVPPAHALVLHPHDRQGGARGAAGKRFD